MKGLLISLQAIAIKHALKSKDADDLLNIVENGIELTSQQCYDILCFSSLSAATLFEATWTRPEFVIENHDLKYVTNAVFNNHGAVLALVYRHEFVVKNHPNPFPRKEDFGFWSNPRPTDHTLRFIYKRTNFDPSSQESVVVRYAHAHAYIGLLKEFVCNDNRTDVTLLMRNIISSTFPQTKSRRREIFNKFASLVDHLMRSPKLDWKDDRLDREKVVEFVCVPALPAKNVKQFLNHPTFDPSTYKFKFPLAVNVSECSQFYFAGSGYVDVFRSRKKWQQMSEQDKWQWRPQALRRKYLLWLLCLSLKRRSIKDLHEELLNLSDIIQDIGCHVIVVMWVVQNLYVVAVEKLGIVQNVVKLKIGSKGTTRSAKNK